MRWVAEAEPGETLSLEVKRGDQLLSLEVKLEAPPRQLMRTMQPSAQPEMSSEPARADSGLELRPWLSCSRWLLAPLALRAHDPPSSPTLPRDRFRSGEETLRAFAPVSEATRYSIVKLNVDGETVALGTVVDTNGLALTKASELKKGKLTCWLATEKEVNAEVLGIDEDEDVALVRVQAQGLKPIQWAAGEVAIGQWAITPGIAETPQAVGIISALPHRIRPPRALIGVQFDFDTTSPHRSESSPG